MSQRPHLAIVGLVAIVLAGCGGGASSTPTSSAAATNSPTASAASATSSPTAAAASPPSSSSPEPAGEEPTPSAELGDFGCDLPIVEPATVPLANIVDVRVGTHAGYDRVVFQFEQGLPEFTLDRASPPFTADASGLPVAVEGESFLRLTMRGGSKQTDAGTSSYNGPTDFDPGFTTLADLVEGGDFERQSTWYLGLNAEACVRVMLLVGEGGSPRLVIDVEH